MVTGAWEPPAAPVTLTMEAVDRLLAAADCLDQETFGLADAEVTELAALARDAGTGSPVDWSGLAAELDSASLLALVRLFTLAEMRFPDWKSGDRSPVIALAARLRQRGEVPAELTGWIRAHSDNRFLPYGSLLRRL